MKPAFDRTKSPYTDQIGKRICARYAQGDKTLREICDDPALPTFGTVYSWLHRGEAGDPRFAAFARSFHRARRARADALADEITVLARKANAVNAHAIRVKIEAHKWLASRLGPDRWGEQTNINLRAEVDVRISQAAPDWIKDRLGIADRAAQAIDVTPRRSNEMTH